jgi:hypothetical protein
MSTSLLKNNSGRGIPSWLNLGAVINVAKDTRAKISSAVGLKTTASANRVVVSYRDSRGHVISAEDPFVSAQTAKGLAPKDKFGEELQPHKVIQAKQMTANANVQSVADVRQVAASERQMHPSYMVDSTLNRHVQYKALQALTDFANSCGMFGARAKYVKGSNAATAGKHFQGYTEITADISWLVGPRMRKTVTATVKVDAAHKLVMPKVFSTADGTEHPFTREAVGELLRGIEFTKPTKEVRRRSDLPNFRKPDPTRFQAVPK